LTLRGLVSVDLIIQKVDGALAWTDYEEKLAKQFYQEELRSGIGSSLIDLN